MFLTGSQAEEGMSRIASNSMIYLQTIGIMTSQVLIYGIAFTGLLRRRGTRSIGGANAETDLANPEPSLTSFSPATIVLSYAIAVGAPWLLGVFEAPAPRRPALNARAAAGVLRMWMLSAGLLFVLLSYVREMT